MSQYPASPDTMLQLDFGSSDATVAAVVPKITQLVDQAVRPVAWDTDQRLIAMWLHGKSINTQRVYRRAAAAWFLEVVGKPLGAVTLGDRQTFSDTPYRKSELSTPDQNPKHSLQIDRRPTAFACRITGRTISHSCCQGKCDPCPRETLLFASASPSGRSRYSQMTSNRQPSNTIVPDVGP